VREPIFDGHGRRIGDLRVSVTDRCNFRCQYCMPAEGLPWLERAEILTFEEITRVVSLFAEMGVGDVRLTGGEPLVRRDFPVLAGMIAAIDGVHDLSVTTNGFLLRHRGILRVRLNHVVAGLGGRVGVASERADAQCGSDRPPGEATRPGDRLELVEVDGPGRQSHGRATG